ncbi:MAG: undecaprenyldiphospho-muramoylpentapeptide beta-N-acetylglucosaminyltransferase [Bacteroidetes bacterium]|nr:undecaprenyldiphospho-muramoylpentapeptide beta-N-acetylglucosaminyltransferase [Bacteroidota bacterium]
MQQNLQQHKYRFIISGGGTGGHIFPAIAIAEALSFKTGKPEILFIGARGRMEMEKVPQAGYPIKGLWISGLQRKISVKNILFPLKVVWSMLIARKIIKTFNPDVVIGTGGYASGPTLKMAASLGIPTVIQEQNSFPGITNRMLAGKASRICVAYEGMEKYFPADKIVFTGNPVRVNILENKGSKDEGLKYFGLEPGRTTVLIVGGSQGARSVNQAISRILGDLTDNNIQLIWQTGPVFYPQACEIIERLKPDSGKYVKALPFIQMMEQAYNAADIVVSRAGAIAISELCIAGKPAILVPLPTAAEDHQMKNARALAEKNAAIVVADHELNKNLKPAILETTQNIHRQKELARNIAGLAVKDSASRIADEILKILKK